jgi:hypothetical protein
MHLLFGLLLLHFVCMAGGEARIFSFNASLLSGMS